MQPHRARSRSTRVGRCLTVNLVASMAGCDVAAPPPDPFNLMIGQANDGPFTELADGDDVQLFSLGQGGVHFFLSYRVSGFDPEALISITVKGERVDDGTIVIREFTQTEAPGQDSSGVVERLDRLIRFDVFPSEIVERDFDLTVTLTDTLDPADSVSVTRRLHVLQPTPS